MSSRSSSEDVYELPIGTEINQIIGQKGYSAAIQIDPSFAERLLPHIREQCVDNGKLIALPLTLTQQTFAYNPEVAQRLGVADIPTTWEELTRFIADWQEPVRRPRGEGGRLPVRLLAEAGAHRARPPAVQGIRRLLPDA